MQRPRGRLLGSGLWGPDNSLDLTVDDTGTITFIKAIYNPGMGIQEIYSLDIADLPQDLHDIGIVTSESIKSKGPGKYWVNDGADLPVIVELGKDRISLTIGQELYAISKPVDFVVEAWPLDDEGRRDTKKRTSYGIIRARKECFLGFSDKAWLPDPKALEGKIDSEAMYYPKQITLTDNHLDALVFNPSDDARPEYGYTYRVQFASDPAVNLRNFLVLLTLRSEMIGRRPLIHPVLLAIYYFDAIMGKSITK